MPPLKLPEPVNKAEVLLSLPTKSESWLKRHNLPLKKSVPLFKQFKSRLKKQFKLWNSDTVALNTGAATLRLQENLSKKLLK